MRPPLANLFAVHVGDGPALDAVMADLQASGEFSEVWRPAHGWVAASAALPGGEPDGEHVRRHQLAFGEGRDILEHHLRDELRDVAALADSKPDRLATLPGDFGFIRFRDGGEATVVRSCGGLVPFYLKRSAAGWAIATRLGDLVRYLPDEPRLDPLVNAIWATGWGMFPNRRTFLEGVTIVERGHFARIGEELKLGRYWNPRPQHISYPTPARAREHAERLRALLISKLERDLDPEDGNLLTLSGGVDSTSLGALAAGVVARKVWTWSLLPGRQDADLLQREMSFIEPLAQQYGFTRRWQTHIGDEHYLGLSRAAPRIVFHVVHPALCSLPRILREAPVRVMFGGEFADQVCGSHFTLPDWARQTSLLRLVTNPEIAIKNPRLIGRWGRKRLATWRGRDELPFPRDLLEPDDNQEQALGLFHETVRQEYLEWWKKKRDELRADTGPWRHLAMDSGEHDGFVAMNWEACSALGVRRSFPFFNREVLELAYECHPAELYGPGTKRLLRAALDDDVPARNLYRADKGGWGARLGKLWQSRQEPMPEESLPHELVEVLRPEWFSQPPERLDYLQQRQLRRLMLFIERLRERRRERGKFANEEHMDRDI